METVSRNLGESAAFNAVSGSAVSEFGADDPSSSASASANPIPFAATTMHVMTTSGFGFIAVGVSRQVSILLVPELASD